MVGYGQWRCRSNRGSCCDGVSQKSETACFALGRIDCQLSLHSGGRRIIDDLVDPRLSSNRRFVLPMHTCRTQTIVMRTTEGVYVAGFWSDYSDINRGNDIGYVDFWLFERIAALNGSVCREWWFTYGRCTCTIPFLLKKEDPELN